MITVNFGTRLQATAMTIFAPSLAMPPASYFLPTMKPVMFCRNTSGMPRWLHSSMKCVPLSADSANSTPLLATMPAGGRAVDLGRLEPRIARLAQAGRRLRDGIQVSDRAARDFERVRIVVGHVIGDARGAGVGIGG